MKRKFLFRCNDCGLILDIDFDDPEDLKKVQENKIELECPCGALCKVLRN